MEENKLSIEVPWRIIVYLLICGTGVLVFILGGIYPSYRNIVRIDGSIASLKAQIEEQKVLSPLYQKLRKELTAGNAVAESIPPKSGLSARWMDNLSPIFGEIAAKCGLEVSGVAPDVKSLVDDPHFLSVGLVLKGNFFNFQKFLLELENLPYMCGIEELQIREGLGAREYFLKTWLMIDNPGPESG
jgi:hypothetical protein